MLYSNVLFVSKDQLYTKAMTLLLKQIFGVKCVAQVSSRLDLQIRNQLLNPEIVLIDSDTCDFEDIETIKTIKSTFPDSVFAILKDDENELANDLDIKNIVTKTHFTDGFTELIKNPLNKEDKHQNTLVEKEQKKKRVFNVFFRKSKKVNDKLK